MWLTFRLDPDHGRGTVEYVALILLVTGVLTGVTGATGGLKDGGIAQTVVGKMKSAIEEVGRVR